jgi:hypothetical protein
VVVAMEKPSSQHVLILGYHENRMPLSKLMSRTQGYRI